MRSVEKDGVVDVANVVIVAAADAIVVVVIDVVVEGGVVDDVDVDVDVDVVSIAVEGSVVVVDVGVGVGGDKRRRAGGVSDKRSEVAGTRQVGGDKVARAIACREAAVTAGSAKLSKVIIIVGLEGQDESICAVCASGENKLSDPLCLLAKMHLSLKSKRRMAAIQQLIVAFSWTLGLLSIPLI
jgi:hypothetical protein